MTLEQYFKSEFEQGKIDHAIRANVDSTGLVTFYIHPASKSGKTCDYVVRGNDLVER